MSRARIVEYFLQLTIKPKFQERHKQIAFAEDLLLLIRGKLVGELENITNTELKKFQRGQEKIKSVLTTKSRKQC